MEDHEQQAVVYDSESIELVAQELARHKDAVDRRFEGVRSDFEVALLEQVGKLLRRIERVEALVTEKVGGDLAKELLSEIRQG